MVKNKNKVKVGIYEYDRDAGIGNKLIEVKRFFNKGLACAFIERKHSKYKLPVPDYYTVARLMN